MAILTTTQNGLDFIGGTTYIQTGGTTLVSIAVNGNIAFNQYGAGTLVTDASGNITVSSGGGAGGPYLPLTAGSSYPLTGDLYLATASNEGNLFFGTADASYKIFGGGTYGYMGYDTGGYHRFLTSGSERFRIASDGKIQVGSDKVIWAGGYGGALVIRQNNATSDRLIKMVTVDSTGAIAYDNVLVVKGANVGIGMTTITNAKLNVNGNLLLDANPEIRYSLTSGGPYLNVRSKDSGTSACGIKIHSPYGSPGYFYGEGSGSGSSSYIGVLDGGGNWALQIRTGTSTSLWANGSNRLHIDSAGNVGIGTTTPLVRLQLERTVSAATSRTAPVNLMYLTSEHPSVGYGGFGTAITHYSRTYQNSTKTEQSKIAFTQQGNSSSTAGSTIDFYTKTLSTGSAAPEMRMRINYNGNVGIGTTSPTSTLTLGNATGNVAELRVLRSNSIPGTYASVNTVGGTSQFGSTGSTRVYSTGNESLYLRTNGSDRLTILSGGNVGIGTTSPTDYGASANTLEVRGASGTGAGLVRVSNAGNTVGAAFYSGSASSTLGTQTNHELNIATNNTSRVVIGNTGAVKFSAYAAGTLVTDASGNISVSSGGGAGGPYLPLSAGSGSSLTDNLYINDVDQNNIGRYGNLRSEVGFTRSAVSGNRWFKVVALGGSPKRLKFSVISTGDNTNSYDNFLISTSGYGMNMHIQKLPGGKYNTSKLVSVAAINPSNSGSVEIWIQLMPIISNTGPTYVACTSDVLDAATILASSTATAPTLTNNDTQLDVSNDNRLYATLQTSRGATFGAKVGIGTNAPAAMLTVAGDSTISGNVGIGTTSPQQLLHISNTSGGFGAEAVLRGSTSTGIPKSEIAFKRFTSGDGAEMVLRTSNSGGTLQDVMTLDTSGNVGIGTTSPVAKLDIALTTGPQLRLTRNAGTEYSTLYSDSAGGLVISSYSSGTSNYQVFSINSSEKVRIINNGNVGIGTTSPDSLLTVSGSSLQNSNNAGIELSNSHNAQTVLLIENTTSRKYEVAVGGSANSIGNGSFYIYDGTAGDARLVIDSSGNVGIGTTSPGSKLQVAGEIRAADGNKGTPSYTFTSDTNTGMYSDTADVIDFTAGGTKSLSVTTSGATVYGSALMPSNAAILLQNQNNNNQFYIRNSGVSDATFQVGQGAPGSNVRFFINGSGNVGIGNTASTASVKLEVTGNTLLKNSNGVGDLYLGNYATANHFRFHTNNANTYFDMNCGDIYWRQGTSTRYQFFPSTANMTVQGTITQNSDARIKENVVEISDCISKVQAMRGVYYNRTDFNTEVTKVGVIAQEVEAVLPELVLESPETGLKSVAYSELTSVLINAIKEQQEIIEDLKTRITKLEN